MAKPTKPSLNRHPSNNTIEYNGLSWIKTAAVLISLLIISAGLYAYIVINKPHAKTLVPAKNIVTVHAKAPGLTDYLIKVSTNGTVSATTRGNLVTQLSGEITNVSINFASGGKFTKGDVLLHIDARDYESNVSRSSASYAESLADLEQEKAEVEQAKRDWARLGFAGKPTDLVLRKPQLAAATAQVKSAKATYDKSRLDFSRTKIRAPYDGTIINTQVGLGQFVVTGSTLGEIFSNEGLEIQLPLNQDQYAQVQINQKPSVLLSATIAGKMHQWRGEVVRSDNIFNTTTRQLNITAKITNPISNKGLELKIGQYVLAIVDGRMAKQAIVVPNQSIREGSYVYLFQQGLLYKRDITIIWQDNQNTVIEGVLPDEQIVLTSLGGAANGARAKLITQLPTSDKKEKQ